MDKPEVNQEVRIGKGKDSRTGIVVAVDEEARVARVALNHRDKYAGGGTAERSYRFEDLSSL